MWGAGYFGKSYFGGGYYGPAPFGGDPTWVTEAKNSDKTTILDSLSVEALESLKRKREAIEKIEALKPAYLEPKPTLDDKIRDGLMQEKLEKPVTVSPDIALMLAIAEAVED